MGSFSPNPNPHLRFSFSDACSFCYDLTIIPEPRPGQPWCEVQGQVDGKTFLSYDCGSDEVKSLSLLGEEVNGTRVWQEQMETLRDVGDLLRQQLPDIELEKYMDRDPLPLQGRMMCQCKAHGHMSASWQFGFHGQMFLLFGSENGTWTVLQPGGRRMRDIITNLSPSYSPIQGPGHHAHCLDPPGDTHLLYYP
ncbi:PREDICTED: NKG2D ligand 2-like [Ceratotherium simum simum]|uniref:NKG2D ligand 2-like n=1 Tax=Ceratotherium simum simum TaxID=73337 RepID=A0ABM1DJL5_CERSS|nr:PREDICTED: NKG2D ligand 2-like [Ceratotherium simum simum]